MVFYSNNLKFYLIVRKRRVKIKNYTDYIDHYWMCMCVLFSKPQEIKNYHAFSVVLSSNSS